MITQKTIKPRGLWILVKPVEKESHELESGLVLPSTEEQEQKAVGIIQDIGNEVDNDIYVGDEVIYGAYAGETIKRREDSKEVEYKLILDEDVIAFLKEDNK